MLTKQALQDFLRDQWNIVVDLHISLRNMTRLTESKYDHEEQVKRHGYFKHHWYQLKFIAVIQVAKLFSERKNDARSFSKLCNLLDTSPYDDALKTALEENSRSSIIAHTREDIKQIVDRTRQSLSSNSALILKFLNARDKVYAHKDSGLGVPIPSVEEIGLMTKLSAQIQNDFNFNIFFTSTPFEESKSWDIDYVLFYMSELRKKDLEELERKKKGGT